MIGQRAGPVLRLLLLSSTCARCLMCRCADKKVEAASGVEGNLNVRIVLRAVNSRRRGGMRSLRRYQPTLLRGTQVQQYNRRRQH